MTQSAATSVDDLFKEFPAATRQALAVAWEALPPDVRDNLVTFLPLFGRHKNRWRQLLELSQVQLAMAFGAKQQVAIIGPTNVGKSTLYNQLIQPSEPPAVVSPLPGTTKTQQAGDAGLFTVIDTPGTDAVGRGAEEERVQALQAARTADFLIIIFDVVQGIHLAEQKLFAQLTMLGKPYIVVLNKMDQVRQAEEELVAGAAQQLDIAPAQIVPTAAISGYNLERVVLAAVKADPALLAVLGQTLPAYRWKLAWRAISGAASTAALVALTPIPLADFVPLLAIQSSLVLGIARIYNYPLTLQRARELLGVLGAGMMGRTLFYQLAKVGGPPGWLVAATVAGGTTVALGYAAVVWFERGEQLSATARQELMQRVAAVLTERLKGLGRQRPSRATLEEEVRQALEASAWATPQK